MVESFKSFRRVRERVNAVGNAHSKRGVVSPAIKYSNWLVTMILLLIGARVLFVVLHWVLGPNDSWRERPLVPLAQAIHAILFLIAAVGIFQWMDWGRLLAIAICAWNLFAGLFLTPPETIHRVARLILRCLGAFDYLAPTSQNKIALRAVRIDFYEPIFDLSGFRV